MSQPRSWRTLQTQELYRSGFFRLRQDRCELPDGRVMPRYYVMEFPDWVNIVPVTPDGEIILVEQFRHASGELTLEIPGGSTDPHAAEAPEAAALRELREETGFVSDRVQFVGRHRPNPAMQNNWMHTFIAWDCRRVGEPQPDPFEDLRLLIKPAGEVFADVRAGRMSHSIVMASLLLALPYLDAVKSTSK